jgi:hypothetical protein
VAKPGRKRHRSRKEHEIDVDRTEQGEEVAEEFRQSQDGEERRHSYSTKYVECDKMRNYQLSTFDVF